MTRVQHAYRRTRVHRQLLRMVEEGQMVMGSNWAALGLPVDLEERHEIYRERIVDAAETEFASRSFSDVKIRRIALGAGLSDATLRRHFTGKVGIWNGMYRHRVAALVERVEASLEQTDDPVDQIFHGLRAVIGFFGDHPDFLELQRANGLCWASADRGRHARGEQHDVWASGRAMLRVGVARAHQAGRLRVDDLDIATGLVVSALQVWLFEGNHRKASGTVANALCTFLEGSVFISDSDGRIG